MGVWRQRCVWRLRFPVVGERVRLSTRSMWTSGWDLCRCGV
jgi:hypothetical protein